MPIRAIRYNRRASRQRSERRITKSIVKRVNKNPEHLTKNEKKTLTEAIPDLFDKNDYQPGYDSEFAKEVKMSLYIQASHLPQ